MNLYFESNHPLNNRIGSIEVICGSMFSGKTEELIRRIKRTKIAKQKVVVFKPKLDDRYSKKSVVSHDLNEITSNAIQHVDTILEEGKNMDVIAIDEAQFFDNELVNVCETLAQAGKRIIIAGLDMDFKGRPFGPMPLLMAIADDVLKVHAICVHCGRPAQFSHRLNQNKNTVLIGEQNEYEPLCRSCFGKPKNA